MTVGVDLNKPRIRAALSAALALAPVPGGFTAAEHAARVRQISGHDGYTTGKRPRLRSSRRRARAIGPRPGRARPLTGDADRDLAGRHHLA